MKLLVTAALLLLPVGCKDTASPSKTAANESQEKADVMEVEVTEELWHVIDQAIEIGLAAVRKDGRAALPYAAYVTSEDLKVQDFYDDVPENALELARQHIRSLTGVHVYAIGCDSRLEMDGEICDAILIEGADEEQLSGVRFGQPYRYDAEAGKGIRLGGLVYIGSCESLLTSQQE